MPAREPAPEATPSFEGAMERLETLVEQMENDRLPLEELIRSYEEGIRLVKVCNERLSAAEQRIEIITRDAAGQAQAVEHAPAPASSAAGPRASAREPKSAPEASPAATASARPPKNSNEVSLF